jgi:hypothetical protein
LRGKTLGEGSGGERGREREIASEFHGWNPPEWDR